ncbi:MAG TPA: glutamate racemase [Candidatus Tumulicola sp.]|jgi:glutamate racemase
MIGLFDSGLGGLTVIRRLRERLPQTDIVYLADQAHVPYGDRDPEELFDLLIANLAWLDAQGVDATVMACNTSCAIAQRYGWPDTRAPALDIIDSAATAVQRAGFRRVGVIATAATVEAGSYGRTLRAAIPGCEVWEVAAPALVPMIEAGRLAGGEPRAAVEAVCRELPRDLDAVIYGCTHYPVLEPHFAAALEAGVTLIDPAAMQAERAAALVGAREPLEESGTTRYVTSGDPVTFKAGIARTLGEAPARVESLKDSRRGKYRRTASS